MKFILLQLFWAGRKIVQIGQTEPTKPFQGLYLVTRSGVCTQREAKFVQNTRHIIIGIR